MSKNIKSIVYILVLVLLITIPIALRKILSSRQDSTVIALSVVPGLPDVVDKPSADYVPVKDVQRAPRAIVNSDHPPFDTASVMSDDLAGDSGPPESVLNKAQQAALSTDETVYGFVRRMIADNPADLTTKISDLSVSENPRMRAIGILLQLESEGWSRARFDELVGLEDLSTALWSAGWLADNGDDAWGSLISDLAGSDVSVGDIHGLLNSGDLGGSAGRAALRLLAELAPDGTLGSEYLSILKNRELPYSVRMMAAVAMSDEMPLKMYQSRINALVSSGKVPALDEDGDGEKTDETVADTDKKPAMDDDIERLRNSTPEDPLLLDGLRRLATQSSGPEMAINVGTAVSPHDIDMVTASMSPVALEDLVIQLEHVLARENPTVYTGTSDKIRNLLASLPEEVTSEEMRIAQQRLEAMQNRLESLEGTGVEFTDAPPAFLNQ